MMESEQLSKAIRLLNSDNNLTDREQNILETRYGIKFSSPKTLEEVGREFGVTRERIRQIECKALEKIMYLVRKN